jgi:hemoglobin-like flavoprotein
MTAEQVQLVKGTWKLLRNVDPVLLGDTFYSKLFSDHPTLGRLFPSDMHQQYRKLVDMLSMIVARLDRWVEMRDEIRALAQRHAGYGVRPAHYKMVGTALLWTLEKGLGLDCTPDVRRAWISCFVLLSNEMIQFSITA